eukprot:SAG22_NODE_4653_length_1204_cov_0.880543_1_plen_328_part_10
MQAIITSALALALCASTADAQCSGQFACASGDNCVSWSQVNDDSDQCPDGTDEEVPIVQHCPPRGGASQAVNYLAFRADPMRDYATVHEQNSATAEECQFPFTHDGVTYNACTNTEIDVAAVGTTPAFTNLVDGALKPWCLRKNGLNSKARTAIGTVTDSPSVSGTNSDVLVADDPQDARYDPDGATADPTTDLAVADGADTYKRYQPTLCADRCVDPGAPPGTTGCSPYLTMPQLSAKDGPGVAVPTHDLPGCTLKWTFTDGYKCRLSAYRDGDCPDEHRESNPLAGITRCGVKEVTSIPDGACAAGATTNTKAKCEAASVGDFKCV